MTPEQLLDIIINGGGAAVMIWVIVGLRQDIAALRTELRDQNTRMWALIEWSFKRDDGDPMPAQFVRRDERPPAS